VGYFFLKNCLVFVVWGLLFIVYCLLFIVYCLLFIVCGLEHTATIKPLNDRRDLNIIFIAMKARSLEGTKLFLNEDANTWKMILTF